LAGFELPKTAELVLGSNTSDSYIKACYVVWVCVHQGHARAYQ